MIARHARCARGLPLACCCLLTAAASFAGQFSGPVWYVAIDGDDSAGNGSAELPFRTIARAVLAAAPWDTVRLYDGVHSGPGNRTIDLAPKPLHLASVSGDPALCAVDCGGLDGFYFEEPANDLDNRVSLRGLTITNAAIAFTLGSEEALYGAPVAHLHVVDCVVRKSVRGVFATAAVARIDSSRFVANGGSAVLLDVSDGTVTHSVFRDNTIGFESAFAASSRDTLIGCEFVGNEIGLDLDLDGHEAVLMDCRIDSSLTVGVRFYSTEFGRLRLEGCQIADNAGNGVQIEVWPDITAVDCAIASNGGHGVAFTEPTCAGPIAFTRVDLLDNDGWGFGLDLSQSSRSLRTIRRASQMFHDCTVSGNGLGGLDCRPDAGLDLQVVGCLVAANGGPGIRLAEPAGGALLGVDSTTIADNLGTGLEIAAGVPELASLLIAFNLGAAIVYTEPDRPAPVCTDLFGNAGGDWTGSLGEIQDVDGNLSADPLFCRESEPAGFYTLAENSPCLATDPPGCGLIGARGAGCAAVWTDVSFADGTPPPIASSDGETGGVALVDYDGDRLLDIYLSGLLGGPERLFRNLGGGGFAPVDAPFLAAAAHGAGLAWAPAGGDTLPDVLLMSTTEPCRLIDVGGPGTFADRTPPELLALPAGGTRGCLWLDADLDGLTDLYVTRVDGANLLLLGEGDYEFRDASDQGAGVGGANVEVAAADYDVDGDQDLYVVRDGEANVLLRNEGSGAFVSLTACSLGDPGHGRGAAWIDVDNDLDLDLYVVNDGEPNVLYENAGSGFATVVSAELQDPGPGRSGAWEDFDLDGDLDLFLTNAGAPNRLLRNEGELAFTDVTPEALADSALTSHGAAWGDIDRDGDPDLVVGNVDGPDRVWRNDLAAGHHWLQVALRGDLANTAGLGARIECHAGDLVQLREVGANRGFWSQNSSWIVFGLGERDAVDSLVVHWPGRDRQVLVSVPVDSLIFVAEDVSGVAVPEQLVARGFSLRPARPNPFNPRTIVGFDLMRASRVALRIYDVRGRLVRSLLADQALPAGSHTAVWQGTDDGDRPVAAGVYLCRLQAEGQQDIQRLALVR